MSYKTAAPNDYLAITGMNMKSDLITKATWVWPFQRCTSFNVQPQDYTMNLQAMTREKLQFLLPAVFTVGPDVNQRGANYQHDDLACHQDDRGDSLMKYAMLLADSTVEKTTRASGMRQSVESRVKGIIEGETRVLVSSMTMEEIFTERELFKRRLFRNIQGKLDLSGLKIFNAKVKESRDAPNSVYFESISRKAREGATHQARIDVAEAQLRSLVRDARRRSKQDHEIAKINAETAMQNMDRDVEGEQAEANPNHRKSTPLADAAAYKTRVDSETLANIDYNRTTKNTDAAAYRTKTDADACDYATIKDVGADLTNKQNDADGLSAIADAYTKLTSGFGGSSGLLQYMMTGGGTYIEPAPSNRIRIPPGLAKICCLSGASAFIIGVAANTPSLGTESILKLATSGSAIMSWGAGLTSIQISESPDVSMAARISTRVACSVFLLSFIFCYTYFFNRDLASRKQFLAGIGGLTSMLWSFVRRESASATGTAGSFLWLDQLNLYILLATTVYILAADTSIMNLIMHTREQSTDEELGAVGNNAGR